MGTSCYHTATLHVAVRVGDASSTRYYLRIAVCNTSVLIMVASSTNRVRQWNYLICTMEVSKFEVITDVRGGWVKNDRTIPAAVLEVFQGHYWNPQPTTGTPSTAVVGSAAAANHSMVYSYAGLTLIDGPLMNMYEYV